MIARPTLALLPVAALAALLLAPASARAGDPSLRWRTIETPHFVIHYHEPLGDVARRVGVVAERSHAIVTSALRHQPRDKTQVVISDDTDGANGWASGAPRNLIHLFTSAPASLSSLNDHDDWQYGLFIHEYTHILHFDIQGGLPALYNRIFGRTWLPNNIQPNWVTEGFSVYQESKRSSSGRNRSSTFDMYLRMPILEGKHLGLDAVSAGPLAYPHGNAAYLYGSHFIKFIADRYGDDKLATLAHEYGQHPIPFDMGRAMRKAVGKNFDALYDEWRAYLTRRYALQKDAVLRRGLIEGRRLTDTGENNSMPRFSPDGKEVAWIRADGHSRFRYRRMPVGADASRGRDLAVIDGAGAFAFLPDGSGLVFERDLAYRTTYDFHDLHLYDFATGAITRLTHGARVGVLDPSPDGKQVVTTLNGAGRLRLAIIPLVPGAEPRVVWKGEGRWDQAHSPAWSPDGKSIVFSAWTTGGYRDLYLHDVASGKTERLTADRAIDAEPRWSPDGRWIYFISDRTGIYNLYALSPASRTLRQVSNVLGGVFTFDVSPDGRRAVYSGFESDGYELFELALDEARWLEPEVYVNDRPDPTDIPDDEIAISAPRDYRPLETLGPKSWTAALVADSFGSAISLTTGGSDVVGLHAWALGGTIGLARGDVSFGGSYAYRRFWPTLSASLGRGIGRPGGLVIDGVNTRYTNESWGASAGVGLPVVRRPGISSDLGFSYDVGWNRSLDPLPEPDPNGAVTRLPESGVIAGLSMRWSLSNVRRYTFSVGAQEGRALSFGVRLNHPTLGSGFQSLETSWRWQEYWPMPWPGHHSVSLRYTGAIEQTNRRADGPYVIGGGPRQDLASAIVDSTRAGNTGYLRGFPPSSIYGRQLHLANLEYRVPLHVIEKGWGTVPFYLRRLHAAALLDAGNAYDGPTALGDFRLSAGAALRLDAEFGFYVAGSFEVGWMRGLTTGGQDEVWFLLTNVI